MAKYDSQINDLPQILASAKSVLIALSPQITTDELASALGLALSLQKSGKQATVVTDSQPTVANSQLFGVGDVKNVLPSSGQGNFIITLENVVDPSGQMQTVPSLEKLDWYPEGSNLNLVFHVIPGQRFEPSRVNFKHENQGFDLIFVIGAGSLSELGIIHSSNPSVFENNPVVNIDISGSNTNFGRYNIVDPAASSLSEVITHLMGSLNLTIDNDIATNLIAGIYEATANMTQRVSADTFSAAAQMIQAGARMPQTSPQPTVVSQQTVSAQPQPIMQQPAQVEPQVVQPQAGGQILNQAQNDSAPQPQASGTVDSSYLSSSPWLTQEPQIQFGPGALASQPSSTPVSSPVPQAPEPQVVQPQVENAFPQVVGQSDASANISSLADIQNQPNPQGIDLRQVFNLPQMPSGAQPVQPLPGLGVSMSDNVNSNMPSENAQKSEDKNPQVASREERPQGEQTYSSSSPEFDGTPAPDWLVPKIFKGGNLG